MLKETTYSQFAIDLIEDIANNLKTTPLVHYGFVQYQKDGGGELLVDPVTKKYNLKHFGLEPSVVHTYCKMKDSFQYARKLDYITEQFACIMAGMVATLTSKTDIGNNDSNFVMENKLFHGLNFNERAAHIVLHPANRQLCNRDHTRQAIESITGKINLHLQLFITSSEIDRLFHLVTPSTRYGSLGYDIQYKYDLDNQTVELTMRLFDMANKDFH